MPNQTLRLPDDMRGKLREPFGKLLGEKEFPSLKGSKIIAVGDIAAYNLLKTGIDPKVVVIDKRTRRGETSQATRDALSSFGAGAEIRVENRPGFIESGVWPAIKRAIRDGGRVVVDGEEDLLAIPCVLLAPDGWSVVYGLPDRGLVVIKVNKEIKEKFNKMLKGFEKWN